ncbi:MAG TPA: hypothetical protein PKE15_06900, partial [Ottowia sp.]|nr:hypothetical protein [Ottowia sp.]
MNRATGLIARARRAWRTATEALLFALLLGCALPLWAQTAAPEPTDAAPSANAAPVVIDGHELFTLRGIRSYPAPERAEMVRQKIITAARDKSIAVTDIHTDEAADRTQIFAGNTLLLGVLDLDGEFEGIDRKILARTFATRIARAIDQYRSERSRPVLIRNTALALAATLVMALMLWVIVRLSRWATGLAQR